MAHKSLVCREPVIRGGRRHHGGRRGHSSAPRNNQGGGCVHEGHRGSNLRAHHGVRVRATHHGVRVRATHHDEVRASRRDGVRASHRDGVRASLHGLVHAILHDIHRDKVLRGNHQLDGCMDPLNDDRLDHNVPKPRCSLLFVVPLSQASFPT